MPDKIELDALGIADQGFLVSSMIERCPKTMMVRELFVNALEAAGRNGDVQGRVNIGVRVIDGARKLCFWNTGSGLSAQELYRICDLAASLNKTTGLDENFGMGAKVASLPSNKCGLRYRSCKDGAVSEVLMLQHEGLYGRLRRSPGPGQAETGVPDVLDVTMLCRSEGTALDRDWTEVVLFGNRPDQDTVADPYNGSPAMPKHWLTTTLVERFHRIPANVAVTLMTGVEGRTSATPLRVNPSDLQQNGRAESVTTRSGVTLHYRFDPALQPQPQAAGPGRACVIHKSEIYSTRGGQQWVVDAPLCGVPFAAPYCSILVELPDDYPVRPEAYREFLRFRGGDQRKVEVVDFGQLMAANMPVWLKQAIEAFGPPKADYLVDIDGELVRLICDLGYPSAFTLVGTKSMSIAPNPAKQEPSPETASTPPAPPPPEAASSPTEPPPPGVRTPEIICLRDEKDLRDRGLEHRAARFYASAHQIFINVNYPSVSNLAKTLKREFDLATMDEGFSTFADELAEAAMVRKVARALVFGLSKQAGEIWPASDVNRCTSMETFSVVADDLSDMLPVMRLRLAEALERASVRVPAHSLPGQAAT